MDTFEALQIAGMKPSLMANKIGIPLKNLRLFFEKIRISEGGCWEWMAAKSGGYGVVKIRSIRDSFIQAHRLAYELVHGPVDASLDVHHLVEKGCIGPFCVNPDHLLPATRRDHLVNLSPNNVAYLSRHRDHCKAGHTYTLESTKMLDNGTRHCRICDKERKQAARDAARGDRSKYKKQVLASHCKRGHALEGDNLYFYDTPWGKQSRCRACQKMRNDRAQGKEVSGY